MANTIFPSVNQVQSLSSTTKPDFAVKRYTMASAMLERVSGKKYEELVKKTLIDDLGLSVHIGWPNSISADQPWGHPPN